MSRPRRRRLPSAPANRHETSRQARRGEIRVQPRPRYLVVGLERQQRTVIAGRLRRQPGDRQGMETGAAPVYFAGERQPGDDLRVILAGSQQKRPPRFLFLLLGKGQDADGGPVFGHFAHHLTRRLAIHHRRMGAVLIACQPPVTGIFVGREHRHGERSLKTQMGGHDFPPDPHQLGLGEGAGMTGDEAAQDLCLAGRAQGRAGTLDAADPLRHKGAPHKEVMNAFVDLVDFTTQIVEILICLVHDNRHWPNLGES
jgi:hypothetical protein